MRRGRAILAACLAAAVACDGDDGGGGPDAVADVPDGQRGDGSVGGEADGSESAPCGGPDGPICGPDERCVADAGVCAPTAEACAPGTRWEPGTPAFEEATADWNLDAIGAAGIRLSAIDVDGDGWMDLLVRRGGTKPDDLSGEGTRQTWLLRNTGEGTFEDVTEASGLLTPRGDHDEDVGRPVHVVAAADVDDDGDVDLYTGIATHGGANNAGETSEVLLNDGSGHFELGPADSAIRRTDGVDAPAGASFVDANRDGHVDLWVAQTDYDAGGGFTVGQDRLYLGDGEGGFEDVTYEAGLTTKSWNDLQALNEGRARSRAWSAAACDLNGDGWTELLAASYGRAPNHLWQGRPTEDGPGVAFTNRSVHSGYAFDDDQSWRDNQFARCFCDGNPGAEGCDEDGDGESDLPPPEIGCGQVNWRHQFDREPFRLGGNSGTTVCADLDDDGDMDLLTTEIRHWWAGSGSDPSEILVNQGGEDPTFERPGREATGLEVPHPTAPTWDEGHITAAVFDFDHDGRQDVYIGATDYPGNRGLLYHQQDELDFRLVPVEGAFEHNRSHGVAVADFDRDGDLDVVAGHSHARCGAEGPTPCYDTQQVRFFENTLGQDGHWLQLRLVGGEGTNRAAIGARVTIEAGERTLTREVGGGHGHYGIQHGLVVHAGLGDRCVADVTVRWPDAEGTTETFRVAADRRYRVVQGEGPEPVAP